LFPRLVAAGDPAGALVSVTELIGFEFVQFGDEGVGVAGEIQERLLGSALGEVGRQAARCS
jgi:hypothetical protein